MTTSIPKTSSSDVPNPEAHKPEVVNLEGLNLLEAPTGTPTEPPKRELFYFPWMASRNFDLAWYFAPLLVAVFASWLVQYPMFAAGLMLAVITNAFGVGPMHQGPTWFFYFDKKNREYWTADRKRLFFYFVGPILVFCLTFGSLVIAPGLGFVAATAWGVQHFVQQNFGVTLLYHNKNGNEAMPARNLLLRSYWTPAIFFVSMFFYKQFDPLPMPFSVMGIFAVLGLLAAFDVVRYLLDIRKQVSAGARINVPAMAFWAVSVLYFVPFVFPGQRIETMWIIPGTMHWFQYIGLNMILVKHKYEDEERKHDIPCGAYALMACLCLGSFMIFLLTQGLKAGFNTHSLEFRMMLGIYFGLANVHYYQDAFFWRFREKFQRESIMPYLLQARKPV